MTRIAERLKPIRVDTIVGFSASSSEHDGAVQGCLSKRARQPLDA